MDFLFPAHYNDAPERMLDFRRFVSDEINQLLFKVIDKVNTNAPNALINTNAWYYSYMKYFDYAPIAYSGKMTREGEGFYAGNSLVNNDGYIMGFIWNCHVFNMKAQILSGAMNLPP